MGGNDINVTKKSIFLYIPIIVPNLQTQSNQTNPLVKVLHYQLIHGLLIENQLTRVRNIS